MLNPLKPGRSSLHPSGVEGALLIAEFGMTFGIMTLSGLHHSGNMHSGKRCRPVTNPSIYRPKYQIKDESQIQLEVTSLQIML